MDIVTYALLNGKIKDYASNVDEWLEENVDPATGYVLDRSLQMENAAAPADMVGDINNDVGNLRNTLSVLDDEIPDTVQTITFDQNGNVQSITHSRNNVAVRTDVFTFAANSVTEVRTLSTGQSLTIVTNLSTLETTITYSEGGN